MTNDGITVQLSEKIPTLACYIVKCQSRDFLTELCCNTIIFCISTFYRSLLRFEIYKIFNILVCLVF